MRDKDRCIFCAAGYMVPTIRQPEVSYIYRSLPAPYNRAGVCLFHRQMLCVSWPAGSQVPEDMARIISAERIRRRKEAYG